MQQSLGKLSWRMPCPHRKEVVFHSTFRKSLLYASTSSNSRTNDHLLLRFLLLLKFGVIGKNLGASILINFQSQDFLRDWTHYNTPLSFLSIHVRNHITKTRNRLFTKDFTAYFIKFWFQANQKIKHYRIPNFWQGCCIFRSYHFKMLKEIKFPTIRLWGCCSRPSWSDHAVWNYEWSSTIRRCE